MLLGQWRGIDAFIYIDDVDIWSDDIDALLTDRLWKIGLLSSL